MHEFLVSVAAFIVLVGVMVFVHELGHFVVAKLCGVRVEAFSLGFGPRLFGFRIGETEYKVCLLPLGGFVKMTGETESGLTGNPSEDNTPEAISDPRAFTARPRWQRMLIGVAGPCFNFLLTLGLMWFYFAFINEVPAGMVKSTTVEWVTPNSAAAVAGVESGDVIVQFDTVKNPDWDAVQEQAVLNANQTVPVAVERAGNALQLSMHVPVIAKSDTFSLNDVGLSPQFSDGPIGVLRVQPGTPAEQSGLLEGDAIESVDGHAFHSVNTLLDYMQAGAGKPMTLTVMRKGVTLQLVATPAKLDTTSWKLGFAPVPIPIREEPLSLESAGGKSLVYFKTNALLVGEILERLFTHRLSVKQMMGPVGIAQAAGEVAETEGWQPKFQLASQISLQLGILNLLPFPILDGGMILLLLIESMLRHDINLVIKERIYTAAFVVLMAFVAFTIFNDVSRLQLFTHVVKP
ncbi:MAG: RIP metalloprotease RseP [Terracidiphilus sp.]